MLPRHHRLTRPQDFRWTIRGGKKAVTSTLVMHALLTHDVETPARVGITVSKAVGGSVVRHRVARQIRHAIALTAVGRDKDALAAVARATAIDGRLADRAAGEPAAVVARGRGILRTIAAVGDGPLPGHLADVAASWAGERGGPIVRLAAADAR